MEPIPAADSNPVGPDTCSFREHALGESSGVLSKDLEELSHCGSLLSCENQDCRCLQSCAWKQQEASEMNKCMETRCASLNEDSVIKVKRHATT